LLESELFGHERGAFTGAVASKPGRFELAKGGTLFLDEIGDLKPEIQVKLLRVLEEKTFERVGGTRKLRMEARIIAATNRNLKEALRHGTFREDLYYRLCTVPIFLPPLRERRFAIPQLVNHLIEKLNRKFNKNIRGVDPKVMKILCQQPWPGNVRELEHVLEYCFVFAKGPVISLQHLPPPEAGGARLEETAGEDPFLSPLQVSEKETIIKALQTANGSKCEAALLLKISRSKLWRRMKIYGIEGADYKN
jgi:transcriptional regulator with PAS, ATPase and Fis domain